MLKLRYCVGAHIDIAKRRARMVRSGFMVFLGMEDYSSIIKKRT